jgi:hypothetical protein
MRSVLARGRMSQAVSATVKECFCAWPLRLPFVLKKQINAAPSAVVQKLHSQIQYLQEYVSLLIGQKKQQ